MIKKIRLCTGVLPPVEEGPSIVFLTRNSLAFYEGVVLENQDHSVMEDPWDDEKRLNESIKFMERFYGEFSKKVFNALNRIHGSAHPPEFWEVTAGLWLLSYIHIMYDRWYRLDLAIRKFGKENLEYCSAPGGLWKSNGLLDFQNKAAGNDVTATHLYAAIAKILGIEVLEVKAGLPSSQVKKNMLKNGVSAWKTRAAEFVKRSLNSVRTGKDILFLDNLGFKIQFDLAGELNGSVFDPALEGRLKFRREKVDRDKLLEIETDGEFERIVVAFLPKMMPSALLEEYRGYMAEAEKFANYGAYFVKSHIYTSPIFAFVAATGRRNGGKVIVGQLGGLYGQPATMQFEQFERKISDRYITWGWSDSRYNGGKLLPLPHPLLTRMKARKKKPGKEGIFAGTSITPQLCRLSSMNFINNLIGYIQYKDIFLGKLSSEVRSELIYRYHHGFFGFPSMEREVLKNHPCGKVENKGRLQTLMLNAKLFICDYQGTAFLESLAMDVPTVLFWKYEEGAERESVREYFELLRKAKILFHDPEKAAEHVDSVWNDVPGWWDGQLVRNARTKFTRSQAWVEKDWKRMWVEGLRGAKNGN